MLPHPVNNRRSISIYGMCEAGRDAGTKKMRLGTTGRPGQSATPQACLSLPAAPRSGQGALGPSMSLATA